MHIPQMLVSDVCIYLRCGDTAMPKHTLYAANIRAVHKQVGRKAVAHRVRADVLGDSSQPRVLRDQSLYTALVESPVVAARARCLSIAAVA